MDNLVIVMHCEKYKNHLSVLVICNVGDLGLIPGLGRSPGEGKGYPLQHSCLRNPTDRGAWRETVHGVAKSGTRPSAFHFRFSYCAQAAETGRRIQGGTERPQDRRG